MLQQDSRRCDVAKETRLIRSETRVRLALLARYHGIVKTIVSETLMTFEACVAQRGILITPECECAGSFRHPPVNLSHDNGSDFLTQCRDFGRDVFKFVGVSYQLCQRSLKTSQRGSNENQPL